MGEDFKYSQLNHIWLPRQDQLQEMVNGDNCVGFIDNPIEYLHLIQEFRYDSYIDFDSMEQLLLSFVMEGKYSKQWNLVFKKWKYAG